MYKDEALASIHDVGTNILPFRHIDMLLLRLSAERKPLLSFAASGLRRKEGSSGGRSTERHLRFS
jgi:hypothetical protein